MDYMLRQQRGNLLKSVPKSELKLHSLRSCRPVYSERVSKPRNREDCHRKGSWCKNTLGCTAGLTLALVCVAAAGLLVVIQ